METITISKDQYNKLLEAAKKYKQERDDYRADILEIADQLKVVEEHTGIFAKIQQLKAANVSQGKAISSFLGWMGKAAFSGKFKNPLLHTAFSRLQPILIKYANLQKQLTDAE
jgi:hypothetical protein